MKKAIIHEDTLDILETFQDALEITYDCDNDDYVFSEAGGYKPPSFMISAAKRGLKFQQNVFSEAKLEPMAGLQLSEKIAEGKPLNIRTIKRIKNFAQRNLDDITPSLNPDSKLAQTLLLKGVPASKSGARRVISWANARIKEYEKYANN